MYRMLIVDDERIIRETLSRHIDWAALDVQVIGTASNGLEAYDIIMDEYPDIVMTDIKMPGFRGWSCCSASSHCTRTLNLSFCPATASSNTPRKPCSGACGTICSSRAATKRSLPACRA